MAFRGTESPMDFEWQGHGPVDPTSPFHRHIMEAQAKKRTHSEFDSPKKSALPSLRAPNNQPFFFSNAPSTTPSASPFRNSSFTTPRKPFDIDFSSGPENSSPLEQTDNEDTPDAKSIPIEFKASPQRMESTRSSLFGLYDKFAPSPGRGEIRKPHGDLMARRIHKKRRRAQKFDKQLMLRTRDTADDSEDDSTPSPAEPQKPKVEEVGWITGLFTFIHTYPDAPSIIAKYLQVFFNAAILGGCLYMFWSFYATIRADVDRASEDAMAEVLAEMAACSKNYIDNRCAADTRLPALETVCSNWELCMNRDPSSVKRARLSAHTFAEIFNSFVEPISLKTMIFTITLVVVGLVVNNATFTLYRRQQENHNTSMYRPPSGSYMHPGQQNGHMGQFAISPVMPYGQPYVGWHGEQSYGGQQQQIEYQRSPSKERRARSRSPSKKFVA
ncbi:Di-sulfide bridge nucleocytoplasmic transport domain-containing protein [Exophiala viscosa]|uniref:Di-sulfide bridge nucleocytoplasmic transport domain-containing protein n=1 Tax=Exophiala viscosa TaxID=2486360 RepID=UPI00219A3A12|nr:Di-sulfide bridge nucleocytoplasmic transport domain-containing protein [Exophiala viscosa]